jgi:hypothetical protein
MDLQLAAGGGVVLVQLQTQQPFFEPVSCWSCALLFILVALACAGNTSRVYGRPNGVGSCGPTKIRHSLFSRTQLRGVAH